MSSFDTKVHHADPVTMKIVKVTPHRRFCRGDTIVFEQPPHSGKFFHEDGTSCSTEQIIALGLKKSEVNDAPVAGSTIAQAFESDRLRKEVEQLKRQLLASEQAADVAPEAVKPAKKKPGRKPGYKKAAKAPEQAQAAPEAPSAA